MCEKNKDCGCGKKTIQVAPRVFIHTDAVGANGYKVTVSTKK